MFYGSGTRYSNNFYVQTVIDPDNGNCAVFIETVTDEGEKVFANGEVVWDEGE